MRRASLGWFSILALGAACGDETVAVSNRPPEVRVPGAQVVVEGQLLAFAVEAFDADEDPVTITPEGLPESAIFNPASGQVLWTPGYQSAGVYSFTFIATDQRFSVTGRVDVTVVDHNRAPALDGVSDLVVEEGSLLAILLSPSDPDGDSVIVTTEQFPTGASFDPAASLFTWRPSYDQSGTYVAVVRISEAGGLFVNYSMRITVLDVNRAPVFDAFSDLTVRETTQLEYIVPVTDPDGDPVDVIATLLPDGNATFEPTARRLRWTPSRGQFGTHRVSLVATDQHLPLETSLSRVTTLTIVVTRANRAPTLDAVPQLSTGENQALTVTLTGRDQDTDQTLQYGAIGPQGSSVSGRDWTWTPDCNAAGDYTLLFSVTDGDRSPGRGRRSRHWTLQLDAWLRSGRRRVARPLGDLLRRGRSVRGRQRD